MEWRVAVFLGNIHELRSSLDNSLYSTFIINAKPITSKKYNAIKRIKSNVQPTRLQTIGHKSCLISDYNFCVPLPAVRSIEPVVCNYRRSRLVFILFYFLRNSFMSLQTENLSNYRKF